METAALGCLAEQGSADIFRLVEKAAVELRSTSTAGSGRSHVGVWNIYLAGGGARARAGRSRLHLLEWPDATARSAYHCRF